MVSTAVKNHSNGYGVLVIMGPFCTLIYPSFLQSFLPSHTETFAYSIEQDDCVHRAQTVDSGSGTGFERRDGDFLPLFSQVGIGAGKKGMNEVSSF